MTDKTGRQTDRQTDIQTRVILQYVPCFAIAVGDINLRDTFRYRTAISNGMSIYMKLSAGFPVLSGSRKGSLDNGKYRHHWTVCSLCTAASSNDNF